MLSMTCEYALRALIRLARVPQGTVILGRELAEDAAIPANYLSKILLALRNAGVLDTARGTGGGYRLRKHPEQIRLLDIVELFDSARAKPLCLLNGNKMCSDLDPCPAHQPWHSVRDAYLQFLESTTIASMARGCAVVDPHPRAARQRGEA